MKTKVKNTSDLRSLLLDTIDGVRSGKIEPRQAQAISNLSCRILQSAKLDLEVAKMNGSLVAPESVTLVGKERSRQLTQ